jgi:protein gp37
MYREKDRYGQDPFTVVRSKPPTFNKPLSKKWAEPAMVFTCSWSDFFHADADEWRPEAWDIIRKTTHLTYQILTKRIERVKDCLPEDWGDGWPHVWLGATTENQETYNERIEHLVSTPAALRFISAEPLLGPIDLGAVKLTKPKLGRIDWVIVGGESGRDARFMEADWVRDLLEQCQLDGIPFFFKQWGAQEEGNTLDGEVYEEFPTDVAEWVRKHGPVAKWMRENSHV